MNTQQCKWPTNPLSQVQVTIGETSMMATPERAYFDAVTVNEAVMAERERINALLAAIREHWVKANGADCISVGALDQIAEVIADGSYVRKEPA